jgi:hypothetical protein
MARHSKSRSKLGTKSSAAGSSKGAKGAADEVPQDPLRAYPADPPQPNVVMLVIAAALFAIWFCVLAYIAFSA